MPKPRLHPRLIQYPFAAGLQGARLESYREEKRGQHLELILEYQAFEKTHSELSERAGRIFEQVSGHLIPARIRFSGVVELQNGAYFKNLPAETDAQTVVDLLTWRQIERNDIFHLLSLKTAEAPDLMFFAWQADFERRPGAAIPVSFERDWCPPAPMPAGLVPRPRAIHRQFGGDPLPVQIDSRLLRRRLFIGGTDIQSETHPSVDFVLNLGEDPSKWAANGVIDPRDRWDNKGEGSAGMSVDVIRQEAEWVIARLRAGQRGLVHCVAGMNRSSTICCAVLILLERLSAEAALARVRATHPWARPDSRHWLALRWLSKISK